MLKRRFFVYHVVYTIEKNGQIGKGSTKIYRNREIKTIKDVDMVSEFIEKENGYKVIIENWIRLKNEYLPK